MFKKIKNLISFLTIIPVGMDSDCLTDAANYMYLFPVVGALIGVLAGLYAWLLFHIFSALLVGILTIGFILLITGLHHTDGLLDFGDGLMCQGAPEKKIEVMHDQQTGTGGLTLGLMTLLTTAFCIGGLNMRIIIQSLIVAEVSAKLAMVLGTWVGKSAHKGMNTYFINAMHDQHRKLRLTAALLISFGMAIPLLQIVGLILVIVGIATGLIMVVISNRHFKGITGDVIGATNELARMASLLIILAAIKWT